VYLAGEVCVEAGEALLHERSLPGGQALHLFAFLAAQHRRTVSRDEIADELWDGAPTAAWTSSLKTLVSRTRAALAAAGVDRRASIIAAPGAYRFHLPADGWVDLAAARSAVHAAETGLAGRRLAQAAGEALVARLITVRPLLPGRTGPWLRAARRELMDLRIHALESSARAQIGQGRPARAVRDAELAVEAAPTREPAWRLLMDAHAAAGDIASALQAYGRCAEAVAAALGVGPSATTRDHHAALLTQAG
jgi:DNA-binding SARP family transcriptional activator